MIKTMMCVCCALVFGVLVSACCEKELTFLAEEECVDRPFEPTRNSCHLPSACCEFGPHALAAICEEHFPHQPTPVMCTGEFPVGVVCATVDVSRWFDCDWGDSRLLCCDLN